MLLTQLLEIWMGLATEPPEVFPFGGKGCKGIGDGPRLIPGSEESTWLGP